MAAMTALTRDDGDDPISRTSSTFRDLPLDSGRGGSYSALSGFLVNRFTDSGKSFSFELLVRIPSFGYSRGGRNEACDRNTFDGFRDFGAGASRHCSAQWIHSTKRLQRFTRSGARWITGYLVGSAIHRTRHMRC